MATQTSPVMTCSDISRQPAEGPVVSIPIDSTVERNNRPPWSNNLKRPSAAFTLIELIVVLVVIATIGGIVFTSLGGYFDRAALTAAGDALKQIDGRARQEAKVRPEGQVTLTIERTTGILSLTTQRRTIQIPSRTAISELWASDPNGELRPASTTATAIAFHSSGSSQSYAVKLTSGRNVAWFAVFGASGQCIRCEHESDFRELW